MKDKTLTKLQWVTGIIGTIAIISIMFQIIGFNSSSLGFSILLISFIVILFLIIWALEQKKR